MKPSETEDFTIGDIISIRWLDHFAYDTRMMPTAADDDIHAATISIGKVVLVTENWLHLAQNWPASRKDEDSGMVIFRKAIVEWKVLGE